jgi:hypothetical protein
MLKRDNQTSRTREADCSADADTRIQADGAEARCASLSSTKYGQCVRVFRSAGEGAACKQATPNTPAPTRYRTHITPCRNRQRLRVVMQLLAGVQRLTVSNGHSTNSAASRANPLSMARRIA